MMTPELARIIRSNFDEESADEENFPSTIDERIYHVKLVLETAAGACRILDAGCGKGRFARLVKRANPQAAVIGMDISTAMLARLDSNLGRCAGLLTSLPFATGMFEAVYATESLEHAVDIEAAVSELCRVLAPGGRLLIIDKNVEHWGRLKTPEWERWFGREELERLLSKHCHRTSSRFISYWEDVEPDGMFLAWQAVK
jgi:malonyl-CoA O-methyltransferase